VKISDIRQKPTDELRAEVRKIHEEHFNLRFRRVTDVIENPGQLRELRRDLARIHTVIRERAAQETAAPAAKPAAKPAAAPTPKSEAKPAKEAKPKGKPGKTKAVKAGKQE
jgi:large subunit ribosomal protein L29